MFQKHEFNEKTGIHRVHLADGGVCIMHTNDDGNSEISFQRLAKHQVPLYKQSSGWRLCWTIRTTEKKLENTDLSTYKQELHIGSGLSLRLKTLAVDTVLKAELLSDLLKYGHVDETTVFGKTFTNNGRMVLDQAMEDGQTYTYAGKTTAPGKAFGQHASAFICDIAAKEFGVTPDKLWAHLVYYPDASKCKLAWHSDSEAGINPHMIMSVTFLEQPVYGIRPFEVRLKSAVHSKNKKQKVKKNA